MSKQLMIDWERLPEKDRKKVEALQAVLSDEPIDVQYKSLRGFPALKGLIKLVGEAKAGGIGAKIVEWLKDAAVQAALRAEYAQVAGYQAELQKSATLKIDLTNPKYRVKFLTDESGEPVDIALKIPVKDAGMAVDFWGKVKHALESFNVKVIELAREANVVGDKTERIPGSLETDPTGVWTLRLPQRKQRGPADPNAPQAAKAVGGMEYTLVYGEGPDEELVAEHISNRTVMANLAAKHARHNNVLVSGKRPFTDKDETQKNLNFPSVYGPKLRKAGYSWKETKIDPTQ